MASADRKAVFLDTNIFLHYQPFEQIPWPAVVKASQVLLVIPPIMVRELNKHKETHPQKKICDRAQKNIMSLNKLFKDELCILLKENMEVLFENTDPLIDFSKHQLSREIQDDHLIASIIAFKEQRLDTPVVLVTSDTGLILKAKALTCHIESVVI